jgi:hypothetical protein
VLARLVGCLLIALVALDVFRTVLLPSARGVFDRGWVTLLWRLARSCREVGAAGGRPLSIVLTIATWVSPAVAGLRAGLPAVGRQPRLLHDVRSRAATCSPRST